MAAEAKKRKCIECCPVCETVFVGRDQEEVVQKRGYCGRHGLEFTFFSKKRKEFCCVECFTAFTQSDEESIATLAKEARGLAKHYYMEVAKLATTVLTSEDFVFGKLANFKWYETTTAKINLEKLGVYLPASLAYAKFAKIVAGIETVVEGMRDKFICVPDMVSLLQKERDVLHLQSLNIDKATDYDVVEHVFVEEIFVKGPRGLIEEWEDFCRDSEQALVYAGKKKYIYVCKQLDKIDDIAVEITFELS